MKGTLERNAKLAKGPISDGNIKHNGGPSGNAKQASVIAKGVNGLRCMLVQSGCACANLQGPTLGKRRVYRWVLRDMSTPKIKVAFVQALRRKLRRQAHKQHKDLQK